MRKVLTFILLVTWVMSMGIESYGQITGTPSDWATGEYNLAADFGIVIQSVTGDCKQAVSREDFCELMVNMIQLSVGYVLPIEKENPFTDTTNPAVLKAYEQGLISGMTQTTFVPKAKITREQVAVMMVNATRLIYKLNGLAFPAYAIGNIHFADEALFSSWSAESIKIAFALGIMGGVGNNRFDPKGYVTIEQSVILIFRTYTRFDESAKNARDSYLANPNPVVPQNPSNNEFNDNIILLQAKFPDQVAKDSLWWDPDMEDVSYSIYLSTGIFYRPLKVSETFKNPGCPYFDGHTNLSDDDDLKQNIYEWAMYDQFEGPFNPTEDGNDAITAIDYVYSRGMKLPTIEQLLSVYKVYPGGLLESKIQWPMGIYWSSEIDEANGMGKAVDMKTGEVVTKPLSFVGFVMGVRDRHEPADFVVIDGVKYYKPLQPDEVGSYGVSEKVDSRGVAWSLLNTDNANSLLTADAFVHDELNLRLPTQEELLKLYAAFPGNSLFAELRWPSSNYWTEGSNRSTVSLLNGSVGKDSINYTGPTNTWYVIPVEMVNDLERFEINGITCYRPETFEEIPSELAPSTYFESNLNKYPLWENKTQLDKFIAYKKTQGYRLLTEDEMFELMVLTPGFVFSAFTGYPCDSYPSNLIYWTSKIDSSGKRRYMDVVKEQFGIPKSDDYTKLNSIVMFTR